MIELIRSYASYCAMYNEPSETRIYEIQKIFRIR